MLYCVRMDVRMPPGTDPALFDRLKAEEKAQSQALQRSGKLGLPLFPFMEISVTSPRQHPSAIHQE